MRLKTALHCALVVAMLSWVLNAHAADRTWNGGGSASYWQTNANWGGTAPVANDRLFFGGTTRLVNTNDLIANTAFTGFIFNSGAGAFVLSGNAISLSGGVTNNSTSAATINNPITFDAAQTWNASSGDLVFGGNIDLLQNLFTTKGAGNITINGSVVNFVGLTNSADGAVLITGALAVQANPNVFTIADGAAADDLTVAGVISGSALKKITKEGAGTLVLSGANTFTGDTIHNAGVVRIEHNTAWGDAANSSSTIASGAALQLQGGISVATSLTINGSGIASDGVLRNLSGNNLLSGTVVLGSASSLGSDSGTLTLVGAISGSFSLTKVGSGMLTLSNNNTYTGGTTVSAGTLNLGASNVLADTGAFIMNGGTFSNSGYSDTLGALTNQISSTIALGTGTAGTLTFASASYTAGTLVIANWTGTTGVSGTANRIFITTAPSATFLTNITFTGFQPGAIRLGTGEIVPSGAAVPTKLVITSVNGGIPPLITSAFSVVVEAQDAGGTARNVTANTAVTLSLNTGSGTLGGTLTGTINAGTNSVTISGVTYSKAESGVILTATRTSGDTLTAGNSSPFTVNNANGNWNIDAAGNWSIAANWSSNPTVPGIAAGDTVGLTYNITAARTVTIDGTSRTVGTLNVGDSASPFLAYTLAASGGAGLTFNNNGSTANLVQATTTAGGFISAPITLSDNLSVSNSSTLTLSGVIGGAKSITKSAAGTLILSGANTFSGGVTLNAGKLSISSDAKLGASSGGITFNGGTLLATESFVSTRPINIAGIGTFETASGRTLEERGAISGNGNMWTVGAVILSGSGSNGTGSVGVNGTLSLRGTAALGGSNLVLLVGILELGNGDFTRPLGPGAGEVDMSAWTFGGAGFAAYGADRVVNLAGNGATVTWGTNSFITAGQPFYLGNWTADHTLDFQNGIDLNGGMGWVLLVPGVGTKAEGKLSGIISGSGNSNFRLDTFFGVGNGLLLSNGSNSYAGATTIASGNLLLGANATGTPGNTVLGSGGSDVLIGETNTAYNAALLTTGAFNVSRNLRARAGNTGVISIGGNSAAASTFSGNVYLGTDGVITGKNLTLTAASGGTVTFSGVIQDATGVTSGFGTVTKTGAGTVLLTGANTYAGATIVSAGTVAVSGSLGTNTVTVINGATLIGIGTIHGPVAIQSGGTLQPGTNNTGTASLTVSNSLNLAGTTRLVLNRTNIQNSSRVSGITTVAYGGTLTVTNLGPALLAGDTFSLFVAASYSGAFTATNLPALTTPLVWDTTRLIVDGTVTVSKGSQTITFPSPGDQIYGVAPITLTASSSSGLTISYSVTAGPAMVAGNVLTITGAGSVTIQASQTGNTNWNAATPVSQTILIAQKSLVVTADDTNRVYSAADPAFTATYSGFVNGDTAGVISGAPAFSTSANASSPVGSYTITAALGTLSAANYNFTTFNNGTLTITRASTANAVSSSANPSPTGSNVTFTATLTALSPASGMPTGTAQFRADGAVLGSPASLASGVAGLTTNSLSHGSHTIVAEYAGDGNFFGSTNTLSPAQVINTRPAAANDTLPRYPTSGVKARAATLLANDTDADADALTLSSVSPTSMQGGSLVTSGTWVFYTRPTDFTNSDSFTYVIADGGALQATGSVSITIVVDLDQSKNIVAVEGLGGNASRVQFLGIAGRTYTIQYTESLSSPDWQPLGTATPDATGWFEFTDTPPVSSPARFYRSTYP